MKQDKILIVGTGAIGGFYGALLAKAGADVSVVCRSDYHTIKKQGYLIKSHDLGHWVFNPSQILSNASEYKGKVDYLFLCTKIIPDIDRVKIIQDAVSPATTIVFIQNGVEVEQQLIDAFPDNEIISGLAFICCNRIKLGVIQHLAYGKLTLGSLRTCSRSLPAAVNCGRTEHRNQSLHGVNEDFEHHPTANGGGAVDLEQVLTSSSNKAQHLSELFLQAGIEAVTSSQIRTSRWLKCLWNASFNPLSVLSDGLSTQEILSSQEKLIRVIMQEVSDIAQACGHALPADSIDINIKNTYAMPPYKTSMLLDYQNHKTMEIEAILGNTIKAAQREQVSCPTIDTLYALMKLKELKMLSIDQK